MILLGVLPVLSLANMITLIRLLLVPVFISLLTSNTPHGEWLAVVVFVAAALTDSIDGYIARFRNEVTEIGQFLDPLVDKVLISAALIGLVGLNKLSPWIATLIISRELIVSFLRVVAKVNGVVVPANSWGKIKTALQILAISWWLLTTNPQNSLLAVVLMGAAVAATLFSGISYFFQTKVQMEQIKIGKDGS